MRRTLAALTALFLSLPGLAEAQRSDRELGATAGPQAAREPVLAQNEDRRDERDRRDAERDRRDVERDRREFDRDRREVERDRDRRDDRRFFNFGGRRYTAVRAPEFRYPRGWAYRHWNTGEVLPGLFLTSAYFFDYGFLGVPPPPPGLRWVRYGPDALLVNVRSGRIVDTVYDAFY
jgi:Ni/Co efflux regulator RcnB